jgi:uncharacterized protein GlcG (DUF336 family)
MNKSVVLIAGGPAVIGSATAVAFAKKDARVVAAGRRDEAGKALVKELRSFGSEAEFINADVLREDDVRALVDETVARFGGLDVGGACQRDRVHRVGRSFVHHRQHPQCRRRSQRELTVSGDRDCAREPTVTTHTRSTINTYQMEGRSPVANVIKKHSISYELAQKMANAAVAKATELGVTENVAILDEGGNLKAFIRMDGTPIPTIEIAQKKAYTALFGVSTQDFFNFIQDDPSLLAGIPTLARVAAWGGGFPIKVDGEVVGAIGVSGAPKVQNDIDCARAALALVPDATPTKK